MEIERLPVYGEWRRSIEDFVALEIAWNNSKLGKEEGARTGEAATKLKCSLGSHGIMVRDSKKTMRRVVLQWQARNMDSANRALF
jgi:hypothetical protein